MSMGLMTRPYSIGGWFSGKAALYSRASDLDPLIGPNILYPNNDYEIFSTSLDTECSCFWDASVINALEWAVECPEDLSQSLCLR